MQRKISNVNEESRSSKRRRRGSSILSNSGKSGGKNSKRFSGHSSRRMDLMEKICKNDEGYGYLSSESENDTKSANRRSRRTRNARREQRMKTRSFQGSTIGISTDGDCSKKDAVDGISLPTPSGWRLLSSQKKPTPEDLSKESRPPSATDASRSSSFTMSSIPKTKDNTRRNPYDRSTSAINDHKINSRSIHNVTTPATKATNLSGTCATTMSRSTVTKPRTTHHVVCAISENLARETCVSSLDAGRPTNLEITKQGNGQTYAETMSFLRMLNPDEVLLNEGRRNSQLATKILAMFGHEANGVEELVNSKRKTLRQKNKNSKLCDLKRDRSHFTDRSVGRIRTKANPDDDLTTVATSSACETDTVVKFIPRSYFDQTKGAELLRKLAREETYNATIVEEYILLSSSYAVLQYAQLCLGASLIRRSLALDVNVGGNQRMNIDRSSMINLELLVNAKTGRTANSLVGTIDCTKTPIGGRLLRTNLMAPPTRLDTINARLDLVDALLEDEEFFYVIMEHLEDLPDVDKMLSYIALSPRKYCGKNGNDILFGTNERPTVTSRIASKGISALVCIKSTLSVIPSFANALEVQLKELDERENLSSISQQQKKKRKFRKGDNMINAEANDDSEDDDFTIEDYSNDSDREDADNTTITDESDLHLGLGTSSTKSKGGSAKKSRHQLLRAILIAMKQPALSRVLNAVTNIFTESTTYTRNSHAMRHQECFALKPNTDGMMDVLRKAFLANVDDIYRLADEYAETYDISVQVRETTSRGYYLSVSADLGLDLPQIFIQPVKNGRFIHCTTEEVYSLNSRAQENVQDLLLMTHGRCQEVLEFIRENYDCLASLSDAIALLDMCHCFADNVASSRMPWCRPVLSDYDEDNCNENESFCRGGAMAIRNGRYAIDVSSVGSTSFLSGGGFVPNDTYSSALQNFTVITGINGSGKTIYLKQIALIVILAHCGSYVPAEEALLPIRDQIYTRIGTSDDQEHNISTFLLEMKETAFICNSTSNKSLFLLDELGRATSNEDGVAIAWSVSEFLLMKRAMTFFVTHYPQISKLAEVYPNVQNQHLGSSMSTADDGSSIISYTHKIMPGPCKSDGDYGVEMAVTCGWPIDIIENARKIRSEARTALPGSDLCEQQQGNTDSNFAENKRNAHKVLCDIAKHLAALKEGGERLSREAKKNYLQELRDRLVPTQDKSLVRMIRNLLLNKGDADKPMILLTGPETNVTSSGDSETSRILATDKDYHEDDIVAQENLTDHRENVRVALPNNHFEEVTEKPTNSAFFSLMHCSSSSSDESITLSIEESTNSDEENSQIKLSAETINLRGENNFLEICPSKIKKNLGDAGISLNDGQPKTPQYRRVGSANISKELNDHHCEIRDIFVSSPKQLTNTADSSNTSLNDSSSSCSESTDIMSSSISSHSSHSQSTTCYES